MKIEDIKVGMLVEVSGVFVPPRVCEVMKIDPNLRYPVEVLPPGGQNWVPADLNEIFPVPKQGG